MSECEECDHCKCRCEECVYIDDEDEFDDDDDLEEDNVEDDFGWALWFMFVVAVMIIIGAL